jgi:hypothetical protein
MSKNLFAISLVILGAGLLLIWSGILVYDPEMLIGIVLAALGVSNTNFSFRSGNRKMIVLSTILFLIGVVLIVKNTYEIVDTRGLVLVSILFISGASFLILFVDNVKQKTFLYSGLGLILASYFSITVLRGFGLFDWLKTVGDFLEIFWPVILIVLGLSIFVKKKK